MSLTNMEMDPMASLFSEESGSLWAAGQSDFLKGRGLLEHGGSAGSLADDLLEEITGQHSIGSAPSEDLPEWMSEKISLTQWIDVADIMPSDLLSAPLSFPSDKASSIEPAEELLQTLMVDDRIPPQPPSAGEQQAPDLVALSPAGCLYSPMSPLSPASPTSSSSTEPPSPIAVPLTVEEQLWQIAEGLTTTFNIDLPEDNQNELLSLQSDLKSNPAPSPLPQIPAESGEEEEKPKRSAPQKKSRAKPKLKTVNDPTIKKSKKRDQNKVAATRYRHKKRAEADTLMTEELELEGKNKELNDKVESLSREIKYLKDLMAEVYKVKGELKILRK